MNASANSFVAALDAAAGTAEAGETRRAALLLHTVSADDRAWLMSQLDDAGRARLQGLVDELQALGIPPAPELLDELGPVEVRPRADHPAARGALQYADPAVLASVLAAEPVELIARVIALGPWRWSGAVLARLGVSQRQQVMDRIVDLSATPERAPSALDARLLALVEARLARLRAQASAPRPAATVVSGRRPDHWLRRWLAPARAVGGPTGGEYRA